MSTSFDEAYSLARHQLENFFRLNRSERQELRCARLAAESATRFCLSSEGANFWALNSNHFSIYLYWLSRTTSLSLGSGSQSLSTKVYLLNKALHSVELYFEVRMPDVFFCEHPIGSVMGRAQYGNGFFFYQNCTVGGSYNKGKLSYPTIGKNVRMYAGASILGNSAVGDNVILGAGTIVKDDTVPSNTLVFGQSPNLILRAKNS